MKTAASIVAIVVAAALGGCAHHQAQNAQAPASTMAQGTAAATCPLAQIQGVHASVADIHNGVAITFTGPERQLDQLKQSVHAMADANDKQGNAFAACPCAAGTYAQGAAEAMPGTQTQQATGTNVPQASSSVDEISTGAVLKLQAKDKSQVQALRSSVRDNVRALRQNCLSQQGQGQGQYGQPDQGQQPYGQ